jgi:SnoaL-like domain
MHLISSAGPAAVLAWHRVAQSRDPVLLADLLADDVVFRSPAVHGDQRGKPLTTTYLTAALAVLGPTLTYRRAWHGGDSAVLEFTARLGDLDVHGIDLLAWNEEDQLTEFSVMVRPYRALERLIDLMQVELTVQR